jgi:hypothetical protein
MITHEFTLLQTAPTFIIGIILFVSLIGFYILGYRVRKMMLRRNENKAVEDLGAINGTLLGLLALLLAFTFGMSNSRYDTRRDLVIKEANAIGTAILRADIYPDSMRQLLRANFKLYLEERIAFYQSGMDFDKMVQHFKKGNEYSNKLWNIATTYAKVDHSTTIASQLIPALNDMIDITTTRRAAGEATIPASILYFLFILCLASAFLLGYDFKNRFDWIVVFGFALMLSATVFTIIDMDRPRSGLINMDLPNEKIIELRLMFSE